MPQGRSAPADRAPAAGPPVSGDPYNRGPDEPTIRRRTLDDMRKLSEEIKSTRTRKA